MYDNDSRGNRLLERARLSQADQRLILVGSRHSLGFEEISESSSVRPHLFADGTGSSGAQGGKGYQGKVQPRRVYKADQVEETTLDERTKAKTKTRTPTTPTTLTRTTRSTRHWTC